jgi:hypothetical protein
MTYKELENLITFKMGLPSLYHIMLGMSIDETDEYQNELDNQQTDNYNLNDFLKEYGVIVERERFTEKMLIHDMSVSIPVEHITEHSIKRLYDELAARMNVVNKQFSITTNADDSIIDLDAKVHTDWFDVKLTQLTDAAKGMNYVVISFICEDDVNLDKLRCLTIIANNEKKFADEIFEYVERKRKQ